MNSSGDRDAALERLLRRAVRDGGASAPPGTCLDAEALAAWADGAPPAGERAASELHLAGCARCQAVLAAMVRATPEIAAPQPWWRRGRLFTWVVPLTAAATVALVGWMLVSPERARMPAQTDQTIVPASSPVAVLKSPAGALEPDGALRNGARLGQRSRAQDEKQAEAAKPPLTYDAQPQRKVRADNERVESPPLDRARDLASSANAIAERRSNITTSTGVVAQSAEGRAVPPAAAPAPPPATATESATVSPGAGGTRLMKEQARAYAEPMTIEVVSPDPSSHWRANGPGKAGVVRRSTDGGSTWTEQSTGVSTPITAGASPSTSVCWLVGRGGMVLLSTDGRTWRRLPFPHATDLVAVRATDAKTAVVTAADGRIFTTKDGGLTWDPPALQELPAAPF